MDKVNPGKDNKRVFPVCGVIGVPVAITSPDEVTRVLTGETDLLRGGYVCVSNVHTTVMAHDDPSYMDIQKNSLFVLPDGKPLSFICRIKGHKEAMRVAGPDLMPLVIKEGLQKGCRHYFYGSTKKTLLLMKRNLSQRFPGIRICGMCAPPFRELTKDEDDYIVSRINSAAPDFVWVGLGAPKQEKWMALHEGKINAVMIGVGAAFDFSAGTKRRAPVWVQRLYLEWLFRLFSDPVHLFRRYLTTNFRFVFLNIKEFFSKSVNHE